MKRNLLYSIALTMLLVIYGCNMKEVSSNWDERAVIVDGDDTDWANVKRQVFEKPAVTVGIRNDEENLYLLIGFKDQSLIRLFQLNGMTLWVDMNGKKKKDIGLRYFGDTDMLSILQGSRGERGGRGGRGGFGGGRGRGAGQPPAMRGLSIVKKDSEPVRPGTGPDSPSAGLKTEFGLYT
ncbi:hypothetical protein IID62_09715, partial [candidate division KSB1 bacterium]|nr:hypothetical protein [candidate division KSB1 bacterium]